MKTPRQRLIKRLDDLWSEVIKKRACYESEISGKLGKQIGGEHVLNSHHICGKSNHALRFDVNNGICITKGEHGFGAHGDKSRQEKFESKVKELRGQDIYERLMEKKHSTKKVCRRVF